MDNQINDTSLSVNTNFADNEECSILNDGHWFIIGASVTGKSHLSYNPAIPCQDNHRIISINDDGWGVAVCCDGAGSRSNSHIGSRFIAYNACEVFKRIVLENKWIESLPEEKEWHELSKRGFAYLVNELSEFAKTENYEPESLACTTLVVVFSPNGILATHIGDGRAGYCNAGYEWYSLISPWKGEEANQTVFLTSNIWGEPDNYIRSRIIYEPPTAFTLMSDGCEKHLYETGIFDELQEKYIEINRPYKPAFDNLVKTLKSICDAEISNPEIAQEIKDKWTRFLKSGNDGLKNESDDKTLILGILK